MLQHICLVKHLKDISKNVLCSRQFPFKGPRSPSAIFNGIKTLILYGEAKCYCFSVSCVPESIKPSHSDPFRFDRKAYSCPNTVCYWLTNVLCEIMIQTMPLSLGK